MSELLDKQVDTQNENKILAFTQALVEEKMTVTQKILLTGGLYKAVSEDRLV